MPGLYRERGVVLRTHKLGEADRIVTFLTEGRGKVRAVAKGVRRPKSRFGARLEPTSHVALQFYEGRSLDVVTQAETIDANRLVREDYPRFASAIAMLEVTDHVAVEDQANTPLYRMLTGALRTLAEAEPMALRLAAHRDGVGGPGPNPPPADPSAVAVGFFWKVLSLEGFEPVLDACVRCDRPAAPGPVPFDVADGGVLCASCAGIVGSAVTVSPDTVDMVRAVLGGGLRAVLAAPPGRALGGAESLALTVLEHHLERRLRSGPILTAVLPSRATNRG